MASKPANKRLAENIEEQRVNAREGREHSPHMAFYDWTEPDGTFTECKTTKRMVDSPNGSREGRYQIAEKNHEKLLDNRGRYEFVLRNENNETVEIAGISADKLDELLIKRDREWPNGSKLKIRWTVVHEAAEVDE
jgi:hypothetical protein